MGISLPYTRVVGVYLKAQETDFWEFPPAAAARIADARNTKIRRITAALTSSKRIITSVGSTARVPAIRTASVHAAAAGVLRWRCFRQRLQWLWEILKNQPDTHVP